MTEAPKVVKTDEGRRYECPVCELVTDNYDSCYGHIRDDHGEVEPRYDPNSGDFYK